MTPLDKLLADPLRPDLDSQSAWSEALLDTLEPFIEWIGDHGGDTSAAREIVAWALIDAAAALAVHQVEIFTPSGRLNQSACDAAVIDFANCARIALLGNVTEIIRE